MADHDRLGANLNEDLRRWVPDRDRQATVRMGEITQEARARGVERGGTLTQAAGKVYRQALHEYRDQASPKQRALADALATEGLAHARYRRRHDRSAPRIALPEDCRELLNDWRSKAEEDPTRPEPEPGLRSIEEGPD